MIISRQLPNGKVACVAWGSITSEPFFSKVGSRGTSKIIFYLMTDTVKDIDGNFQRETIQCVAWRDVAEYCRALEKRDEILVVGEIVKDEYKSQRSTADILQIKIDMILPQALMMPMMQEASIHNGEVPPDENENGDVLYGDI